MKAFLLALLFSLLLFFVLWGLIHTKLREQSQIKQRIRHLNETDGKIVVQAKTNGPKKLSDVPFVDRVMKPLVHHLEHYINQLAPKQLSQEINRRLIRAGRAGDWTVPQFTTTSILGAATTCGVMYLLLQDANYALIQKLIFLLLGGVLGGLMPLVCLNIMIQKRQQKILRQLPEVLDLLCVSVQAGLSFDASLRKIVERMKGPFVDECRRLQEDIRMGMVRRTAMKNVAMRCDVQDVSLFMTSLIQAERLGTSMGKTLKNQADNIRERRRQFVKGEAMKAPVKIIFPLVLFIFPALFVVALIPTLLVLMKNM